MAPPVLTLAEDVADLRRWSAIPSIILWRQQPAERRREAEHVEAKAWRRSRSTESNIDGAWFLETPNTAWTERAPDRERSW